MAIAFANEAVKPLIDAYSTHAQVVSSKHDDNVNRPQTEYTGSVHDLPSSLSESLGRITDTQSALDILHKIDKYGMKVAPGAANEVRRRFIDSFTTSLGLDEPEFAAAYGKAQPKQRSL